MPAAVDAFTKGPAQLTSPPEQAFDIAPSDIEDLPNVTRAIYVGGGGDLRVQTSGGSIVTYRNLPSGALKPGRYRKVFSTGTTCQYLVGEY